MQRIRPAIAIDPRIFGRRQHETDAPADMPPESSLSDDLKLFGSTFTAGFLFVFLMIA